MTLNDLEYGNSEIFNVTRELLVSTILFGARKMIQEQVA